MFIDVKQKRRHSIEFCIQNRLFHVNLNSYKQIPKIHVGIWYLPLYALIVSITSALQKFDCQAQTIFPLYPRGIPLPWVSITRCQSIGYLLHPICLHSIRRRAGTLIDPTYAISIFELSTNASSNSYSTRGAARDTPYLDWK